jgi:hypothetical protein
MSNVPYRTLGDPEKLFSNLAQRKVSLCLSQSFRGVMLTQELSLISLNADRALVQMRHNWLPANPGDYTYLHSPDFDQVLVARVLAVNIQLGEMALGDFLPIGRSWTDRGHDRVQPRLPVRVMVRLSDNPLHASLENLSIDGVGLLAYKPLEKGFELTPGQALKIDFELPQIRGRLSLSGRMVNIQYHGSRVACLGINTFPNTEQARSLERYISYRKQEILEELDQVTSEVLEPHSVKELYF